MGTVLVAIDDLWTQVWSIETPKDVLWSEGGKEGFFIDVYDWDTIFVDDKQNATNLLSTHITLCSGFYQCALTLSGLAAKAAARIENGSITCLASTGCTKVELESLDLQCNRNSTNSPALVIHGAQLEITGISFVGCETLQLAVLYHVWVRIQK